MPRFLLSIYQPENETPPRELLDKVMADMNALIEEAKAAGVWVLNGGLHPPRTAAVVRVRRGDLLTTDGPFVELKEHIGGFLVVEVEDREAALEWAGKVARVLTLPGQADGLSVEVRPFHHG